MTFSSSPESEATLYPFGPIEGNKWFIQISSQWESQKNRFACFSLGKTQFYLPAFEISRSCLTASEHSSQCFQQIWQVGKEGKVGKVGKVGRVGKVGKERKVRKVGCESNGCQLSTRFYKFSNKNGEK
jgi:hypothetical protein